MDDRNTLPMMPADGDILAFRGRGFWSALIKLRTFSRVTHVGFAYNFRGQIWVVEARELRGVRLVPLKTYAADCNYQIDWYPLRAREFGIDRTELISSALGNVGSRYASPWQFLRSWGWISRPVADYFGLAEDTNEGRFFCSEFVLAKLREAGYRLNGHKLPARTNPGDVLELECLGGRRPLI
jgi:hypothetical protein